MEGVGFALSADRFDWRDDALCAALGDKHERGEAGGIPLDDWHHVDVVGEPWRVQRLLDCCNNCPVLAECRDYALTEDPDPKWAVWGGLLPTQIVKLRKKVA